MALPLRHGAISKPAHAETRIPDSAAAMSRAKRAMDLTLSLAMIVLATPLIAVIIVAIKVTSRGPVLFRQRRLGFRGAEFIVLKFRTMEHGASDAPHREYVRTMVNGGGCRSTPGGPYKLTDDARITLVGRLLRRTSLDELPQLWNVLRGEMSLVGPRPPLPYEVELYEPWQLERLRVRPGVTGLWQVSGRNRLSYVDMCRLDVDYVRHWSLREDIRIMLNTPWVMVTNSGCAE